MSGAVLVLSIQKFIATTDMLEILAAAVHLVCKYTDTKSLDCCRWVKHHDDDDDGDSTPSRIMVHPFKL